MTLRTHLFSACALLAITQAAWADYPAGYPGIPPQVDAGAVISWDIHNNQQRRVEDELIYGNGYYGGGYYSSGNGNYATPRRSVMCSARNSRRQTFVASGVDAQVVVPNLVSYCAQTDRTNACAATVRCR